MSNNSQNGRKVAVPLRILENLNYDHIMFLILILKKCSRNNKKFIEENRCSFINRLEASTYVDCFDKALLYLIEEGFISVFKCKKSEVLVLEVNDWEDYISYPIDK